MVRGGSAHRARRGVMPLVALAASLAIHMLFLALLLRGRAEVPRRISVPFDVELVYAAPPVPAPLPASDAVLAPGAPPQRERIAAAPPPPPVAAPRPAGHPFRGTMLEGLEAPPSERRPDLSVRWRGAPPAGGDE